MTEDDDWFERALTGDDEDEDDGEQAMEPPEDGSDPEQDGGEGADGEPADEERTGGERTDDEPADGEGTDGEEAGADDDAGADDGDDGGAEPEDDDELFQEDFASELEGAGEAGEGSPFDGADGEDAAGFDEGGEDPFGGAGGGDDPFGGGGGDDPFGGGGGEGFGGGGGEGFGGGMGDEFGMGEMGMGGGSSADFDEEDLDSEIDRIDLGVPGLDDMIRGGVPDSSLMAVIGSAGTGKTTFGLQFLQHGLDDGERAIYITLEESKERVVRSAEEKGWPYRDHLEEGRLAVVDMDPIEMANSLSSIRSELPRLVDRFGASRLVLDSVSLLEMMYDDRATRRNEIYTFARTLKESGVTILLTSEADEDNPYASRHGIVEYLTDAVYVLQYVRPSDFRETRLAVEIQKIRDAHHSREMKPYEITDEGLSVYQQANIF